MASACVVVATAIALSASAKSPFILAEGDPASSLTTPSLRKGVVVIADADASADATWPVALSIYGDVALRPRVIDRDARALAGAPPDEKQPIETRELFDLRAKVKGDDVAARALLAELARRTGARAIVIVHAPTSATPTTAQLYDAADDRVEPTLFRADLLKSGEGGWTSLLAALHGRYGGGSANGANATPSSSTTATTSTAGDASKASSSFVSSPWFWGAIGAAAVLGAVFYAATRDTGQGAPSPVRIEWPTK